jgi:hypothetical protein
MTGRRLRITGHGSEPRAQQRRKRRSSPARRKLTDREVVIAYWCEGSKNKPGRRDGRVIFTNSDPALIRFFLKIPSGGRNPAGGRRIEGWAEAITNGGS